MTPSLSGQLTRWVVGLIAVTAVFGVAASYVYAFAEAQDFQDDTLRQIAFMLPANRLHDLLQGGPLVGEDDRDVQAFIVPIGEAVVGAPPKETTRPTELPGEFSDGLHDFNAAGASWRAFVRTAGPGQRFAVVQSTEARDDSARDSALRTLLPFLILLPVLLFAVIFVVNRLFLPLGKLAVDLEARRGDRVSIVPMDEIPTEVRPFIDSINRLLQRLHASLEQQRRFVADAAHELRSPVAALSLQVENLQPVISTDEGATRLELLRRGLLRMGGLVEQLMTFARTQAGSASPQGEIQVDRVVTDVVADLLPMSDAREIDLGVVQLDASILRGTPEDLYSLVRNVVDNAIRYAPSGSKIDLSLRRIHDEFVFEVVDEGPGLDATELERVFDAFYRPAGTPGQGSGLGLAIVRGAAMRLGGTVSLSCRENCSACGLQFQFKYPAIPAPQAPRRS